MREDFDLYYKNECIVREVQIENSLMHYDNTNSISCNKIKTF